VRVLIADDVPERAGILEALCEGVPVEVTTPALLARLREDRDVMLVILAPMSQGPLAMAASIADLRKRVPKAMIALVVDGQQQLPPDVVTLPPIVDLSVGPRVSELIAVASAKAVPGTTIVGETPAIQALVRRLPMLAQTDATVLITGESGTGKEVFARRMHELSHRRDRPFVAVNCGAIAVSLIESELFGYKRGAFTDAVKDTLGLIAEAEGGTLFLDEIGEISPAVQVKLLRFLQSKEFKPVGSAKTERADVRIIAATHRDLRHQVSIGAFREDLFYRINIIPVVVPPLRDRKADIPVLAEHFLRIYRKEHGRQANRFSAEVAARLCTHHWPGNVRELENRVQQLVVMTAGEIVKDFADDLVSVTEPGEAEDAVSATAGAFRAEKQRVIDEFERAYVSRVLADARGNIAEAARVAGLDRKSFWQLARRHGLHGQGRARIAPATSPSSAGARAP